jgi:histone deacetylase HOS3
MGLRERKTKPAYTFDDDELDRKLRRKTVAGPTVHAAETASRGPTPAPGKQPKTARRLSAASSLVSSEGKDSLPSASRPASVRATSATDVTSGHEPAMSAADLNNSNLKVKKTRVPVRKEQVLRASRALKKQPAPTNGAPQQAAGSATAAAPGSSTGKAGDEVDKLAGEMKKIKITVLTKAQKEARERERAIREKLANADTISVASPLAGKGPQSQPAPPSAPTDTTIAGTTGSLPSLSPSPAREPPQIQSPTDSLALLPQEATTPITPGESLVSPPMTEPRSIPLPPLPASSPPPQAMSSPLGEAPTMAAAAAAAAADNFIPYQPDGPTPKNPTAPHHHQQLQWLPPNVSATPVQSPARREDLPVFTSTSVIPFAMGPTTARETGVNGGGGKGEGEGEGGTKTAGSAEGSG